MGFREDRSVEPIKSHRMAAYSASSLADTNTHQSGSSSSSLNSIDQVSRGLRWMFGE